MDLCKDTWQSPHRKEAFQQALDVTDSASLAAFVASTMARYARPGICVTNPRRRPSNLFKNTQPEDWRSARACS
jgi:NAD(P)-dependent dehydrogenase (short-subunit alcohol dehydrogenase family)